MPKRVLEKKGERGDISLGYTKDYTAMAKATRNETAILKIDDTTMDNTHTSFKVKENLAGTIRSVDIPVETLRGKRLFAEGEDKEAKIAISAYKNLRTRVLREMEELKTNLLLIGGATQNVGKTLTAINLALALSRRSSKRVVLVDMDLRSPSLHHLFEFDSDKNIVDVAEGNCSLADALVDPNINGMYILPGSQRVEDSSEAIVSEEMLQLYDEFRQQDDTIFVFDSPPVLGCDDVAAVAPHMDACLFVISEKSTSKKELEQSLQILGDTINIIGITVNRSSEGNFDSYYY